LDAVDEYDVGPLASVDADSELEPVVGGDDTVVHTQADAITNCSAT
jgi:hypothetical protein